MVVHELLERHLTHAAIKRAITHLRLKYDADWPLQHAALWVPADHADPEAQQRKRTIVEGGVDTATGELVLEPSDLVAIASDLRRGGWAARTVEGLEHIEVNPDRLSGRPTIRGRRLAVEDVANLAAQASGRATLREDYGLTDVEVDDAVRWWRAVRVFEEAQAA